MTANFVVLHNIKSYSHRIILYDSNLDTSKLEHLTLLLVVVLPNKLLIVCSYYFLKYLYYYYSNRFYMCVHVKKFFESFLFS